MREILKRKQPPPLRRVARVGGWVLAGPRGAGRAEEGHSILVGRAGGTKTWA
jgi:hypothetical protein